MKKGSILKMSRYNQFQLVPSNGIYHGISKETVAELSEAGHIIKADLIGNEYQLSGGVE